MDIGFDNQPGVVAVNYKDGRGNYQNFLRRNEMSKQVKMNKPKAILSIFGLPEMENKRIEDIAKWLELQASHLRMLLISKPNKEGYSSRFRARFM